MLLKRRGLIAKKAALLFDLNYKKSMSLYETDLENVLKMTHVSMWCVYAKTSKIKTNFLGIVLTVAIQ